MVAAYSQRNLPRRTVGRDVSTHRILLFGAEGQLGREIEALASLRGIPLKGLSRSACDITDQLAIEAAIAAYQPALLVNTAAYTAVDRAEKEPEVARAVNATAPGLIAKIATKNNIPLLHFSTDYVFDGTKRGAYNEEDKVAPLGTYGRSKEEGERQIRKACHQHIIVRTAWIYGIHGTNFLKTMLEFADKRPVLRVVADQRGCPTAAIDLAEATLAAREMIMQGTEPWGTFHFAGQGETSWYEFAQRIMIERAAILGSAPQVEPITTAEYSTPAKRPANSVLDSSLFAATFGLRPKPWQECVRDAVAVLTK